MHARPGVGEVVALPMRSGRVPIAELGRLVLADRAAADEELEGGVEAGDGGYDESRRDDQGADLLGEEVRVRVRMRGGTTSPGETIKVPT